MGTDKEKLGELLAELEKISNTKINGQKIDLSIDGTTYKDIDKKAKSLLRKFHPDKVITYSEEDKKVCNRITQIINSVRELMKNYKTENNIQDTDEFTYAKEALEEYYRKNKSKANKQTSRSSTQKSSSNKTKSTSSNKTSGNRTTNNSSKSTQGVDELHFSKGILRKNIRDGKQVSYRTKDGYIIYGYNFKDIHGKIHEIYSENTFEELSEPKCKYEIENHILSSDNLRRANSYDVQKEDSQYGYVGKVYPDYDFGFSSYVHKINKNIKSELREATLRNTKQLSFKGGTLTRRFDNNNEQVLYRMKDGSKIYGYNFKDVHGKIHEIYSENTFEELSEPKCKYEIENHILSSDNLRRANSYDVQKEDSQYGYVGSVYLDYDFGFSSYTHRINGNVKSELRKATLRNTKQLSFKDGILTKRFGNNNEQVSYRMRDGSKIYGYNFKDVHGKIHEIYSENTFEELSEPKCKYEIENHILSSDNLRRAASYDVQNENSQYGYVGSVYLDYDFGFSSYTHRINGNVKSDLREATLRNTKELSFKDGILTKKLGQNKEQASYRMKNGSTIYGYKFKDVHSRIHEIYSENTFEELSEPKSKSAVENYLLSSDNLRRANSYNVQNRDSQYGYVGSVSREYGIGFPSYTHRINGNVKGELREKFEYAPSMSCAKDSSGRQDTITLGNGKKLYGYEISKQSGDRVQKRRVFFENTPGEITKAMNEFISNGHNMLDVYDILIDGFENCEQKYGYIGNFTSNGAKVDERISEELRERFEKIKAKRTFEGFMAKELAYEDKINQMLDEK